jgi:hypothetical protein
VTRTEVPFDGICKENGIRHLLTAPYSPTTTGKIERLHKTMRAELLHSGRYDTIEDAQSGLDAWVVHYNTERPHQAIGDVPPSVRFALCAAAPQPELPVVDVGPEQAKAAAIPASVMPPALRLVNRDGSISLACHRYPVARWLAGETVEIVCGDHLVDIFHHGVLVVSHVARHQSNTNIAGRKRLNPPPGPAGGSFGDGPRPSPPVSRQLRPRLPGWRRQQRRLDATGRVAFASHAAPLRNVGGR